MASVQDRWRRKDPVTGRLLPTELDGKGLRYRAQFSDPSGWQVMKAFTPWATSDVEAERSGGVWASLAGDGNRS